MLRHTGISRTARVIDYDAVRDVAHVSTVGLPIAWLTDENREQGFVVVGDVGTVLDNYSRVSIQNVDGRWHVMDVDP